MPEQDIQNLRPATLEVAAGIARGILHTAEVLEVDWKTFMYVILADMKALTGDIEDD